MLIKPAPGVSVRDPITKRHLPVDGKEVPESTFWMRRLKAGEVVTVEQIPDSQQIPDSVAASAEESA